MNAEASESNATTIRWDLSDDDEYIDTIDIEEEEPENHLKDRVDELLDKIKPLLKGDNFSLELKDVPRYVSRKQIEDFFEISDSSESYTGEVDDPDPKNKRDVIVHFYTPKAFCEALRKNGRTISSYTFDVNYNPNIHHKLKVRNSSKSYDASNSKHDHYRRNYHRDNSNSRAEQSGDVRNQNTDSRDFGRNRNSHKGERGRDGRRESHKRNDRNNRPGSNSSSYTTSSNRVNFKQNEPKQKYENNNRFCGISDDEE